RAGAGHAVRLQESPRAGLILKTYSGTRQPGATAKRAQYRRGNAPGSHNALCLVCWSFAYSALASFRMGKKGTVNTARRKRATAESSFGVSGPGSAGPGATRRDRDRLSAIPSTLRAVDMRLLATEGPRLFRPG